MPGVYACASVCSQSPCVTRMDAMCGQACCVHQITPFQLHMLPRSGPLQKSHVLGYLVPTPLHTTRASLQLKHIDMGPLPRRNSMPIELPGEYSIMVQAGGQNEDYNRNKAWCLPR